MDRSQQLTHMKSSLAETRQDLIPEGQPELRVVNTTGWLLTMAQVQTVGPCVAKLADRTVKADSTYRNMIINHITSILNRFKYINPFN